MHRLVREESRTNESALVRYLHLHIAYASNAVDNNETHTSLVKDEQFNIYLMVLDLKYLRDADVSAELTEQTEIFTV